MITHSVRIAGRRYVALLAAVGLIAGCQSVVAPERVVQILEIAPQKVPCVGEGQQECLQIRGSGETDWQYFYGEIVGFTFEPGHAYVVRVERLTVKNPPADGSSYEYRLLEVISKTPPGSSWASRAAGAYQFV